MQVKSDNQDTYVDSNRNIAVDLGPKVGTFGGLRGLVNFTPH